MYKLDPITCLTLDPGLKRIAQYLLLVDVRKHNKYCPACKNYEEGLDLTPQNMQDFLEYVRASLKVRSRRQADSDSEENNYSQLSEH